MQAAVDLDELYDASYRGQVVNAEAWVRTVAHEPVATERRRREA